MEPENDDFQKESPFQGLIFRFHVKLQGCNYIIEIGFAFGSLALESEICNADFLTNSRRNISVVGSCKWNSPD